MPTALIAHPWADVYGSDGQLLESIDGLRDAGWDVTLCLPASRSLVELVHGSDVQRAPFAVLCKALLRLLPLRPVLRTPIDLARLLHRIRVIRPDVMYVKTVTTPLWSIAARLARKPVVLHVHEAETNAAKPLRAGLNAPLDLRERSLIMVTYAGDAALGAGPAEVRWLRARVAELEARNEVMAAQLAAGSGHCFGRRGAVCG